MSWINSGYIAQFDIHKNSMKLRRTVRSQVVDIERFPEIWLSGDEFGEPETDRILDYLEDWIGTRKIIFDKFGYGGIQEYYLIVGFDAESNRLLPSSDDV